MIKFILKFKTLAITRLSISSICVSSLSHAHLYSPQVKVNYQSRIKVIPITRVQNKLLPQAPYTRTLGHTFKRKFSFQN
ncbi:MAG: hypothetical protein ACJA0T_000058 [Colwellia sp.]|jgi:hypothetical protein